MKNNIAYEMINPTWMLEVTRKCLCNCQHCLRGKPQNKKMEEWQIHSILSKFNVNTLTITGGEPLLNTSFLSSIYGTNVDSLWFATSGVYPKKEQKNIENFLSALKEYNSSIYISISVSEDKYHPNTDFKDTLDNFGIEFEIQNTTLIKSPVMMGKCEWGDKVIGYVSVEEPLFYVNVLGDLYPVCDMSYTFQNRFKKELCFGNVTDFYTEEDVFNAFIEKFGDKEFKVIMSEGSCTIER